MAAGPPLESLYQKNKSQGVAMLGLDVYNGSQTQLEGFRSRARVSFPLLKRARGGMRAFKRGDLVVVDQKGIVRYLGKMEVSTNRQRAQETVAILLNEQPVADPQQIARQPNVDFNSDGQIDFNDFLSFAASYGTTDPIFDLDQSGQVDFPDFLTFAQLFHQSNN